MGNVYIPLFSVWKAAENVCRTLCLTFSLIWWETPEQHPSPVLSFLFYNSNGRQDPQLRFIQPRSDLYCASHCRTWRDIVCYRLLSTRWWQRWVVLFCCCLALPHTPHSYISTYFRCKSIRIVGQGKSYNGIMQDHVILMRVVNRVVERSIMLVLLAMMLPG